jgi:hypothetical protein
MPALLRRGDPQASRQAQPLGVVVTMSSEPTSSSMRYAQTLGRRWVEPPAPAPMPRTGTRKVPRVRVEPAKAKPPTPLVLDEAEVERIRDLRPLAQGNIRDLLGRD